MAIWCWRPRRRQSQPRWQQIEAFASDLQSLPSWHDLKDNTLLFEAFEWHVPCDNLHWHRLQRILPSLQSIGVDALWLPPGCKAMNPTGNGYDIYDLWDLGEFHQKGVRATKWGSWEALQALVAEMHARQLDVYWDAVLNHRAGADYPERFEAVKVDPKHRNMEISPPSWISGWTGFSFPGRGEVYSSQKYTWQHFSGVDWDDASQTNAIFKIHGKRWAEDVGHELGNYDYLMFANVDYADPEVRADVLAWGRWMGERLGLRGMRLDAAKHFSAGFQKELLAHLRATTRPDFRVIGEYWTGDVGELVRYVKTMEGAGGVLAVDAPLVHAFSRVSLHHGGDLRGVLRGTLMERCPGNALTFVENHDTQPGQMMANTIAPDFKLLAYALILLRQEGHPCLFYGDLYGIWNGQRAVLDEAYARKLPILTRARKHFAYGEQQDYLEEGGCIGFIRYGNARHPAGLACVLSAPQKPTATLKHRTKRMYVGQRHAHATWREVLQPQEGATTHVVIDARGYGEFPVAATGGWYAGVWVEAVAAEGARLDEVFDHDIYGTTAEQP
ncbi:alpha-amylase [Aspergillus saccharolyticus JOP 1030-1]|uniref:Putative alpha-amylase n=1 Tax=Aspergillus saccharolyticus JOP 1030-1 TaxID=1450539 RepID=A0A318Z6M9_9EURO|nr:putative alpha-amylase [Aspergillus saccharolyticus JOP 1030-1]PYH42945.1 putative alpha-amylase [Aspergillus saccharolyticus JOP 1030-1]